MMKRYNTLAVFLVFISGVIAISSCDQTISTKFEESFQKVKQVTPINGAQNVTMDLTKNSSDSFFSVSLNGKEMEGWCIEWNEDASFGINEGTNLYSTKGQDAWKELNYFMRIKDKLRANDPNLSYQEIQVVIWSLIDSPSFDVDKISEYNNISERIYKDGETLFDVQKVKDIVNDVKNHFITAKSTVEYEEPGVTLFENDGQTIMTGGETAFAVKTVDGAVDAGYSNCFSEEIITDVSFPRWGWTNKLSENSGDISFDIYAGAGKCDLSKGTLVGKLTANYTNGTLTVKYEMTEISPYTGNLYTMTTAHLYAGTDAYPQNNGGYTVAPGQYTIVDDPLSDLTEVSYTIEDLSGPIYFIAHTDVSGFNPNDE